MSDTPSVLVFNDTDDFNSTVLNTAFSSLDLRMRAIEALNISYEEAVNTLNQYGLQRLNDAMQPVYDVLVKISQLGVIFSTTSTSSVAVGAGTKFFTIAEASRQQFAPAAYVTAINTADESQVLYGRTQSYNRNTGELSILVDAFEGTAGVTVSTWSIMPAVDLGGVRSFVSMAQAVDNETALALSIALG